MNIQQLRYFRAVTEQGSFSAAAREEGVSVQAVSKALGELECEFGEPLFRRSSIGAVPTRFGMRLTPYVNRVLSGIDALYGFASEHSKGGDGSSLLCVKLAVPAFPNSHAVCCGLEHFLEENLGMEVSFDVCRGEDGLAELMGGDLDALITLGTYENIACDSIKIGTLPAGVVVRRDHPLASRESVTFADLAPYPVCFASGFDDFNETIVNLYIKHGLPSKPVRVSSRDEFEALFDGRRGFAMSVGIPGIATTHLSKLLKLEAPCNIPVSVYAITMKNRKSPQYLDFERFMAREFVHLLGTFGA